MINNKFLKEAIVTAIIFMLILLLMNGDYTESGFIKVAWQGFLFIPFYYIMISVINKKNEK